MKINVLEYLEESALQFPDQIALKDVNHEVTYAQLLQQAKSIGTYITHHCKRRKSPIAVCIDRNIESIILFLGIVYSGNFYVPLDTGMPIDRVRMILEDLSPVMILASGEQTIAGRQVIPYTEIENALEADEVALQEIRRTSIDTDPLYGIFTSGSTGRPKGVLISHRSVIDLVEQFTDSFPFPKEAVFGNQAPFDFDVSVKDIYNAMKLGATLVVVPKQYFSMPLHLIQYLNEQKINVLIWAVSALRIVENFKTFKKAVPEYIKLIMFSGEIMPVQVLNYWREVLPDTTFVNLYGPTEITCNCTYYRIDREFALEESIPIGRAFSNTEILLLDEEHKTVITTPHTQGEICVRGTSLALGYYNDEEKTEKAFIQNPLTSAYPDRVYCTGDLGYYDESGILYYTSRKDYQIKHMGHRIELGEIEVVVNALPTIAAAVCVFDEVHGKIVLCYQCKEKSEDAPGQAKTLMIERLKEKLPKFMWPNRYQYYEQLPLNKNGKIDRVVLKKEASTS